METFENRVVQMVTGNIGIGNTSTLATFNRDLGRKCVGFTKMDKGEIRRIKKEAFATKTKAGEKGHLA